MNEGNNIEHKVIDYIKDDITDSVAIENCISDAIKSDERTIVFDGTACETLFGTEQNGIKVK